MKTIFSKTLALAMVAASVSMTMTSCDDDDDDDDNSTVDVAETLKNATLQAINENYVDNIVIQTYQDLANSAEDLLGYVEAFEADPTQTNLDKVCSEWKTSRKHWEYSESFLFGAAGDWSIDPHIDTWPLDETALAKALSDYKSSDKGEAAQNVLIYNVTQTQNLTGFHAMEYIIFSEGANKTASDIDEDEIYYLKLVAEDLFYNTCILEFGWAGEDALSSSHKQILEDNEFDKDTNYGEWFKNAGQAGSPYASVLDATLQILDGCSDIIGEVSESKIGKPAKDGDATYIESPYSYNSIQDFYDNIISCARSLYGTYSLSSIESASDLISATNSVMAYALVNYTSEATAVQTELVEALIKIKAMKAPFAIYYEDNSADEAIDALNDLDDAIGELRDAMSAE